MRFSLIWVIGVVALGCGTSDRASGGVVGPDSGGGDARGAGGSSTSAGPASAYVSAAVGPLANSSVCPLNANRPFVTIGGSATPRPNTVADGGPVHVSCTVAAAGDGFDVQAQASTPGGGGGTLTMSGHVTAAGGKDLSASFTQTMFGTYAETGGCTVNFIGDPMPTPPAVSAGHIWGAIRCSNLTNTAETYPNPDGGRPQESRCDGLAYFLFEGCATH